MGKIVVGVDESVPSKAALEWAIEEALLRTCHLDVVVSWEVPVLVSSEPVMVPMPDTDVLEGNANLIAHRVVDSSSLEASGVAYTIVTPEGRPGEELVALGADADLLVVGSHGSGHLKELLLGSVSSYVTHHSRCPVVLVRTPEDDD
jgi:nucleotide-binding universal stress UspA family protein